MGSSMSLMDRFKAGKPLIGPEEDESGITADGHVARGDNYMSRDRTELAFDQYAKAAVKDPGLVEARFKKGGILLGNGLYGQAMAEFAAVLEKDPGHAEAHQAVGRIYFDNRMREEARRHLERAVALDDGLIEAHVLLGACLNHMDEYEAAVAVFTRAAELSPRSGYIYNNLGLSLVRLNRLDHAVEAFRKALMLGAPTDRTCNNLGMTLFELGREAEALEAFKCAGDEAAAYNNLGYAYFLDDRHEKAALCFEKAIELRPTFYVRADENLKRARLAGKFAESAPEGGEPSGTRARGIPAALNAEDSLRVEPAVASGVRADDPEVEKTMKIYSESPAKLAVKNPDKPIFSVHVSSWRTADKARRRVEGLAKMGVTARVVEAEIEGKGLWYRVMVGAFAEYDKAMDALEGVTKKIGDNDMRVIRCAPGGECERASM
jgi:tetratricopeptide (TPR) repeat protein